VTLGTLLEHTSLQPLRRHERPELGALGWLVQRGKAWGGCCSSPSPHSIAAQPHGHGTTAAEANRTPDGAQEGLFLLDPFIPSWHVLQLKNQIEDLLLHCERIFLNP